MGTNNPSEEQIELVQSRVIDLAQSLTDDAAMLDANAYFDECGFDLEARGSQLSAKIKEYCAGAEGIDDLDPSIEDHPQPRRMARYLLENVEYEILEKSLSSALIQSKPSVPNTAIKTVSGDGALLFGYPRKLVIALAAVLLLMVLAITAIVVMSSGDQAPSSHFGGGGGGGGGGGRAARKAAKLGKHNHSE